MAVVAPMPRAMVAMTASENPGAPYELAKRIAEIEKKIFSQRKTPLSVVLLAYRLDGTKLQRSLPPRLRGRTWPARSLSSACKARCPTHLFQEAVDQRSVQQRDSRGG